MTGPETVAPPRVALLAIGGHPNARLALMVGLHETASGAELRAWLSDIG